MSHTFSDILRFQLLPWLAQNGAARFIVAQPKMSAAQMPPGVQLSRRKISDSRVIIKNRRYYNNERSVAALWPDAGLNEVNNPKLACVLSGHVNYQIGNYAVQCGAGHFIFIPPGTPHPDGSLCYADAQKGAKCEMLFFSLHQNAIECWASHWDENGYRLGEKFLVLHARATSLLQTFCEELAGNEEQALVIAEKLLFGFLLLLQRETAAGRVQPIRSPVTQRPNQAQGKSFNASEFKTRLEQHIQTNLHKSLTLESVARAMLLSRTQLIRLMRRETGQSFNEFLSAHRIAEAKRHLQDSQWTIASIAYFVGFKSPSYFRTFFRERTGQTPSQFRALSRQDGSTL